MDINFNDLEKLIKIAERANIDSLEVVDGNKRIAIVCQPPHKSDTQSPKNNSIQQTRSGATPVSEPNNAIAQDHVSQDDALINDTSNSNQITAPMLGTFYRRSDPSADVFVSVGDSVAAGDTLCVIEAMKIMHKVKADSAGIIEEILVEDGDVVEFDQALFTISIS